MKRLNGFWLNPTRNRCYFVEIMDNPVMLNYLADVLASFRNYKSLADKSFAQVSDAEFFRSIDAEANSIAAITKHLAGNFRSRWTDFLTSDGEKPNRHRDLEFVTLENETRQNLLESWENGWMILLAAVESLAPEDLSKTVTIRNEEHTVIEALNRALSHCAYHVGQIILLAKHFRSNDWQTLSVPRNKSQEFNAFVKTRTEETSERLDRFGALQEFNAKLQS
ncbi:MAG: DUF1572 family protein [Pyrinomonadaceae bacterium]